MFSPSCYPDQMFSPSTKADVYRAQRRKIILTTAITYN